MKHFFVLFCLFILLNSVTAQVVGQAAVFQSPLPASNSGSATPGTPLPANPNAIASDNSNLPLSGVSKEAPSYSSFQCLSPSASPENFARTNLSPIEAGRLLHIPRSGFLGNQITNPMNGVLNGGEPKKLDNNVVAVPTGDGATALLKQVPDTKFAPEQMQQHLNQYHPGDFAVGLILYDSVRIGRCLSEKDGDCGTRGDNMFKRYSGAGIIADFKTVTGDIKKGLSTWVQSEDGIPGYNEEQTEAIKAGTALQLETAQELQMKQLQFNKKLMRNLLETRDFGVSVQSNCVSSNCLISTYSVFDKHFNSWFSANLVVGNFGPTLFGSARKLFIRGAHMSWLPNLSDSAFMKWFRRSFTGPDSWLGQKYGHDALLELDAMGRGDVRTKLIEATGEWDSGYTGIKGGSMRKFMSSLAEKDGVLDKMTPHERGEFTTAIRKLRTWAKGMKESVQYDKGIYDKIAGQYGLDSPAELAARVQFALKNAKRMLMYDEQLNLDFPEWFIKQDASQLYKYGVRNTETGEVLSLTGDSANFQAILGKFADDGHFNDWIGKRGVKIYEVDPAGKIQFYKIGKGNLVGNVGVEDLGKYVDPRLQRMAILTDGTQIEINPSTIPFIQANSAGTVQVFEGSGWEKAMSEGPEEFSRRMVQWREATGKMGSMAGNLDNLWNLLVEKNFYGANRRYASLLDKAFSEDTQLIKNYFSLGGGAKYTILPFAYWQAKQGFGIENLAGYQLPDTWREIEGYLGDNPIYANSYADFFANEGSDEGDIFRQVLHKLPWAMLLDVANEQFNPLKEQYAWLTGQGINPDTQTAIQRGSVTRTDVKDIAFLTSSGDNCPGCQSILSLSRGPNGQNELQFQSQTNQASRAHIVEDVGANDLKQGGTTLISFMHLVNFRGNQVNNGRKSSEDGQPIDLAQARRDAETCKDKLKKISGGFVTSGSPALAALYLGGLETAGYALFGFPGIIGSITQQIVLSTQLQDCVDDVEGYYVHLYAPGADAQGEKKNSQQIGSEKAAGLVQDISEGIVGKTSQPSQKEVEEIQPISPTDNPFEKFKKEIANQAVELNQKAKASALLQANIDLRGSTGGSLFARDVLFYWFKGNAIPTAYDTDTIAILVDRNNAVTIDKQKGQVLYNGQPVVTNPDLARLTMINGAIPAYEIPQRIGIIGLPNSDELVFETQMNAPGEVFVLNDQVANCIRESVFEQTGVELKDPRGLSEAFGKLQLIATTTHPQIQIDEKTKTILADGTPRQTLTGENASVQIAANGITLLSHGQGNRDGAILVGRLNSIQFENGSITYKPSPNGGGELLVWLRHHDKAVLDQSDVSGLKAKPTSVKNPETNCDEPAVDLSAVPVAGSDKSKYQVDNFNASMEKMGPFQIFDTATKRYIFYSRLENGACIPYFKIIDKATGKVLEDAPIQGNIEQTPTGIKFQTADGKTHALDFSAENGIPRIAYNGGTPEVLQTAQGPNGSFYYDPAKGQWYPENAQLIPLNDAYRQQGFLTNANPNGTVATNPGGNPINVNVGAGGSKDSPFNLPSLPENPLFLLLFVFVLLSGIFFIQNRFFH